MSTDDLFPPASDVATDELTTAVTQPAEESRPEVTAPTAPHAPRTRWAAIVWGLVFTALAAAGIVLTANAENFDGLLSWIAGMDAATAIGYGVLTVGILVLVVGVVGLLRRAQKGLTARRAAE